MPISTSRCSAYTDQPNHQSHLPPESWVGSLTSGRLIHPLRLGLGIGHIWDSDLVLTWKELLGGGFAWIPSSYLSGPLAEPFSSVEHVFPAYGVVLSPQGSCPQGY